MIQHSLNFLLFHKKESVNFNSKGPWWLMRKLLDPVMAFPYYRDKIRATRRPPVEHPRCVSHPSTITRWPRSARFQHQLMENFQSGVENGKSCSLLFFPSGWNFVNSVSKCRTPHRSLDRLQMQRR